MSSVKLWMIIIALHHHQLTTNLGFTFSLLGINSSEIVRLNMKVADPTDETDIICLLIIFDKVRRR